MAGSCNDDPDGRKDLSMEREFLSAKILVGIIIVLIISSSIYFYIVRRDTKKPRFITAIFVILNIALLAWFVLIVLIRQLSELTIPKKDEKLEFWTAISLSVLISTLVCMVHWIFAINYFEVAINS